MKVATIIVTYNGEKFIRRCLEELLKQVHPKSVYVIDNGSKDSTLELVEPFEVNVLRSKLNLGFGKANNLGMAKAITDGFDYVFLLNQDCYVQDGCVYSLSKVIEQHPEVGILSPVHKNSSGSGWDHGFEQHLAKSDISLSVNHPSEKVHHVNFVNAAAWLIPKHILEKVGGFDPIFPHYGEDDNFANRVLYHGNKVAVFDLPAVIHDRVERNSKFDAGVEFRNFLARATHLDTDPSEEHSRTIRKWGLEAKNAIIQLKIATVGTCLGLMLKARLWKKRISLSREQSMNPPKPYLYLNESDN